MILELDCGNSLMKWRLIDAGGRRLARGVAISESELLEQVRGVEHQVDACRLVSVRSEDETRILCQLLERAFGVVPRCVESAVELAGVRNGYEDFRRLGLDRWVALVAAYQLRRRACLVIDLGTAVTCDLVDAEGQHLGGYICPGLPLMRNQLRTHTRRIRYDDQAAEQALHGLAPGVSTVEAVERGCLLMLRGMLEGQVAVAQQYLGDEFDIYLTGGDADLVRDVLPRACDIPDLVFLGLSVACPLE